MSQEGIEFSQSSYEEIFNVVDESKKNEKSIGKRNNRANILSVEEGKNVFRVCPGIGEGGVPYMPIRYSLMPVEVDVYNENTNEPTGEKQWVNKRCYIATQHGPRKNGKMLLKVDPIEFYIDRVTEACRKKSTSLTELDKMTLPLRGYRDTNNKWIWGLTPFTRIVCYAWDIENNFGKLELYPAWFEKMKELNKIENENNKEPYDIFSHPDKGAPVVITKTIKQINNRKKTEYLISQLQLDKNKKQSWDDFFQENSVTQEMANDLIDIPTLESLYWQNYTLEHFARIQKSLVYFDKKNGYNLFADEYFLSDWEKVQNHIEKYVVSRSKNESNSADDKQHEVEKPLLERPYEELTPDQVEEAIRGYITVKYGDDQEMPVLSITESKIWFKLAQKGEALPLNDDDDDLSGLY